MVAALSPSYVVAREGFLAAAAAAGVRVVSHAHPLTGLEGEPLSVDVAELGDASSTDVVLVVSGTHGVEGYTGSALQTEWLTRLAAGGASIPGGVRVVLVHGLNPYGFSWVRRVNEDNVDLNRNFVDWSVGGPANTEYERIADLVVPESWDEAEQTRTTLALLELVNEIGLDAVQSIVSRGQYTCPTGVFYGGTGPTWSNTWLRGWCAENLSDARHLAIIDLHTGLGPSGHGELIGHEPRTAAAHQRATAWWGDVRSMSDGESVSAVLEGDWLGATASMAPTAEITAVALEYGTVDPISVLQSLRSDAWLHAHGDPRGSDAAAVRAQVRAAFADDDPAWIDVVWQRFDEVLTAALANIGTGAAGSAS
jgi:predicted deacylase